MSKEEQSTLERNDAGVPLAPCPPAPRARHRGPGAAGQARGLPGWRSLMWAGLMLLTGTLCTVSAKILFNVHADGLEHCDEGTSTHCPFNKPWFTVLLMKIAMSSCLLLHFATKPSARQRASGECEPEASTVAIMRIALPSFFDLLNVVLSNIGLVWVSSSIYQMTRGSVVVFSAMMSVRLLGRRLIAYQYWAVGVVTIAVILVGIAGVCASGAGSASTLEIVVGLLLILASQVVLAYQIVVEERMFVNDHITVFQITGYEGLWGLVMMAVMAPLLTLTPGGSSPLVPTYHEDFLDSFVKLSNSKTLVAWSLVYCVVIAFYNVSGQAVTKYLSAVLRSILEACRTLGVWMADLLLFYALGMEADGEAWTAWSFLELAGFAALVYGTLAYKGYVPMPCARPQREPDIPSQNSAPPSQTGSWLA